MITKFEETNFVIFSDDRKTSGYGNFCTVIFIAGRRGHETPLVNKLQLLLRRLSQNFLYKMFYDEQFTIIERK